MNVVLFSASLRDFRPVWFLWPIMLFFSLLMLSFIPAIKEKLCFVRSVRGLKVFVRTPLCKISSTGEIEQRFRLN